MGEGNGYRAVNRGSLLSVHIPSDLSLLTPDSDRDIRGACSNWFGPRAPKVSRGRANCGCMMAADEADRARGSFAQQIHVISNHPSAGWFRGIAEL